MTLHDCKLWILNSAIPWWSIINPPLLEKYVAVCLFRVNRSKKFQTRTGWNDIWIQTPTSTTSQLSDLEEASHALWTPASLLFKKVSLFKALVFTNLGLLTKPRVFKGLREAECPTLLCQMTCYKYMIHGVLTSCKISQLEHGPCFLTAWTTELD